MRAAQEDIHGQQAELGFLHDIESNDGRLMIFQLPAALPIPLGAGAGPGPGAAAAADGRPAQLPELGMSRIGKLLVFESGAIKLQVCLTVRGVEGEGWAAGGGR